jgi:hypothetical protein
MLYIPLHLHAALTRKTNGRSLGTFQKAMFFRKSGIFGQKNAISNSLNGYTWIVAAFHRYVDAAFVAIDCIVNMSCRSKDETHKHTHTHTQCYEHIYRPTHTMHTPLVWRQRRVIEMCWHQGGQTG